jgi:hypothetical protein
MAVHAFYRMAMKMSGDDGRATAAEVWAEAQAQA